MTQQRLLESSKQIGKQTHKNVWCAVLRRRKGTQSIGAQESWWLMIARLGAHLVLRQVLIPWLQTVPCPVLVRLVGCHSSPTLVVDCSLFMSSLQSPHSMIYGCPSLGTRRTSVRAPMTCPRNRLHIVVYVKVHVKCPRAEPLSPSRVHDFLWFEPAINTPQTVLASPARMGRLGAFSHYPVDPSPFPLAHPLWRD